jgi:hypothetical protein
VWAATLLSRPVSGSSNLHDAACGTVQVTPSEDPRQKVQLLEHDSWEPRLMVLPTPLHVLTSKEYQSAIWIALASHPL